MVFIYGTHQAKNAVEHAQNVWRHILLCMCKVSSGPLLSIDRVYSIWQWTAKALIRLRMRCLIYAAVHTCREGTFSFGTAHMKVVCIYRPDLKIGSFSRERPLKNEEFSHLPKQTMWGWVLTEQTTTHKCGTINYKGTHTFERGRVFFYHNLNVCFFLFFFFKKILFIFSLKM